MEHDIKTRDTLLDSLRKEDTSTFQKYKELYVGGNSLMTLIKYELLMTFLSPIPGALGFTLRKAFYHTLFEKMGRGTVFGTDVTLRNPGRVALGCHNFIDNNVVLDAKGSDSHISLGDSVYVGNCTIVSCASGVIEIGNDVSIGPNCMIRVGIGPVKIGSHITIGAHTVIISGSPNYALTDSLMKHQVGSVKGISMGNDIWIGVGARIIDGVNIGDGSVIGAGAVVIRDVEEKTIVAGVPAKVIKSREAEI